MRTLLQLLCLLALSPAALEATHAATRVRATGTPDAQALAAHAANGGALVVDLRTPPEGLTAVALEAARSGLDYVNLPVGSEPASPAVMERFGALVEAADGAVLVHCASGNRAGEVLARWLLEQGASREEALARGRAAGLQPAREPFVGAADLSP